MSNSLSGHVLAYPSMEYSITNRNYTVGPTDLQLEEAGAMSLEYYSVK